MGQNKGSGQFLKIAEKTPNFLKIAEKPLRRCALPVQRRRSALPKKMAETPFQKAMWRCTLKVQRGRSANDDFCRISDAKLGFQTPYLSTQTSPNTFLSPIRSKIRWLSSNYSIPTISHSKSIISCISPSGVILVYN